LTLSLLLPAEPVFDPAPDDFLDLLEKARAVGLELGRHELPGRPVLDSPLGFRGGFLAVRHVLGSSAVAAFVSIGTRAGGSVARSSGAWCASVNPELRGSSPEMGDAHALLPQSA
jgi:hypothetical protein